MRLATPIQGVTGLEAIIDVAAGVLAERSLTATLNGMARALAGIVPFTSLALYETDHAGGTLVPVFAVGRYVAETMADRPPLHASIAGGVVRTREMAHLQPPDPRLRLYTIPGTPDEGREAIVVAPLIVGDEVIGALAVWREDAEAPWFAAEEASSSAGSRRSRPSRMPTPGSATSSSGRP